jgi:hypothetical protein
MLGSWLLWLAAAGWLAAGAAVGVQEWRIARQWPVAYAEGKGSCRGEVSTGTLLELQKAADAEREAADKTPFAVEMHDKVERCKRGAACRDRGTLK